MITLSEAKEAIAAWKEHSDFEVAGGVWKGKPFVHDIDLVVRNENVQAVLSALSKRKAACEVELYIPFEGHEEKLLNALRATTYEAISGRLMSGVRFRKLKVYS